MPKRNPNYFVVIGVGVWLGFTSPARAYHDDHVRITSDTAYTLGEQGDVHLGLWRVDVALFDSLDVGTNPWFWAVPLPNLRAKWRLWSADRWAVAVRASLYHTNTEWMYWLNVDSRAELSIIPLEAFLAAPIADDWTVHAGFVATTIVLEGTYDPAEFEGAAGTSNEQLQLAVEWRATSVTKLMLTLRGLLGERLRGDVRLTARPDEFTEIDVVGAAQLRGEENRRAGSVMLSSIFSWSKFNLRVGLGFGNYNVQGLNLMLPVRTPIAELDIFWRL